MLLGLSSSSLRPLPALSEAEGRSYLSALCVKSPLSSSHKNKNGTVETVPPSASCYLIAVICYPSPNYILYLPKSSSLKPSR